MKTIKLFFYVGIALVFSHARAKPIGDYRFLAKVISLNSNTAMIEAEGKKYKVPRTALKGEPSSGKIHEVVLSQKEYKEMTSEK